MNSKNLPIGVFDSGVGGLTVVREIIKQLPGENIVYFGDTAPVPYGSKSEDTIIHFSRQIVNFLKTKNVKAVVVACNTVSAIALDVLNKVYDVPIIGVVKPGAVQAAESTCNGRIGVIGTEATIRSHIYSKYIKEHKKDAEIIEKACPLFVPIVEEGILDHVITREAVSYYLSDLVNTGIDTLVLGCTHYPILYSSIKAFTKDNIKLVNPALETAKALKQLLESENILNDGTGPLDDQNKYRFYMSDSVKKFREFADNVINVDNIYTEKINIENY